MKKIVFFIYDDKFNEKIKKKKYFLRIEMTDCFHSPAIKCFPSTVDEVYAGVAYCNALATQIVSANLNSYQNAFCAKSNCIYDPCLLQDYSEIDGCDFGCIAKKYQILPNCLYGCCSDPFASTSQNNNYACSNPTNTTNVTWTSVQAWTALNAPSAYDYYCT
jgi:hypothetical protein